MKNLRFTAVLAISLGLFACGGNSAETTEENATTTETPAVDYKGMEMVDLSEYDVPASMYLADQSKGKRDIRMSEMGTTQVEVGKNLGIEIVPFGLTVAEKKAELSGDLVYQTEFTEETDNKLVYIKTIPDSEVEPEHHFYYTVELEGDLYAVKSLNKAYSKKAIEKMVMAAKSIKPANPA